jgi:hypothetical protein
MNTRKSKKKEPSEHEGSDQSEDKRSVTGSESNSDGKMLGKKRVFQSNTSNQEKKSGKSNQQVLYMF